MDKGTGIPMTGKEAKAFTARSPKGSRILIVGLGNLLLRDDGVGVQAVRELQKDPPAGVVVVEVGTAILDALHLLEWADRILAIDAMQAGGIAGTIYPVLVSDVDDRGPQSSLHELTLMAALRFLPEGKRPATMILGIEPAVIDYGLDLSPKVKSQLPILIRSVREIVDYWQLDSSPAR